SPTSRHPLTHIPSYSILFHSNPPSPPAIYTLSLHDALPIFTAAPARPAGTLRAGAADRQRRPASAARSTTRAGLPGGWDRVAFEDRKSTRLNSSHLVISYAVFCLKKKKKQVQTSQS